MEEIDSERRRAEKNGNTKNWIRVWNMHVRMLFSLCFLWTRDSRGMRLLFGCPALSLYLSISHTLCETFAALWIYQCWHFSCVLADCMWLLLLFSLSFFLRCLLYLMSFGSFVAWLVGWFRVHHSIPFAGLHVLFSRWVCVCVSVRTNTRCVNMCVSCTELTHVEN